ncbi:MAG: hypothetical protein QM768_13430 [Agriterribacter sp.]
MSRNKIIRILLFVLSASNCILILLLYKKEPVAPSVNIVFDGENVGYATVKDSHHSEFWNNYPYVVATTEGKLIDTFINICGEGYSKVQDLRGKLIYRYFKNTDEDRLDDTTFKIVSTFSNIVILTDSNSLSSLNKKKLAYQTQNNVFLLSGEKMNMNCEQMSRSYFFTISKNNNLSNLYFPRAETPATTTKYLAYNLKRASFF